MREYGLLWNPHLESFLNVKEISNTINKGKDITRIYSVRQIIQQTLKT